MKAQAGMLLASFLLFLSLTSCVSAGPSQETAEQVASCLGIDPPQDSSWDEIRSYLFHEAFYPGMPKEEVHQVLDCFGPWSIETADGPDEGSFHPGIGQMVFRENIQFDREDIHRVMRKWFFYYDEEGGFISVQISDP